MVVPMFYLILFLSKKFFLINANVETLHFENGCLKESNVIELRLRCSLYEHIEIIRVIYGYSKQRSIHQCQFSIYDCIQEGASHNILSCNGKQTCIINLTKNEILSTTVKTKGVPSCPDFNYVQINFACLPDAKDICDSWKDEGAIIHLSHTRSRDKKYNECQCKVRSSLSDGQVLLHAREMNRQFASLKEFNNVNTDCKKTTYLEIATDRSERKCMDNLPSNGNALFGSGSNNFTLTYVRNDPFSELFFYFELKASPKKKDHHVQIICNWARRTTTTRTTLPMTRKRKLTTISVLRGGKLSRLDLIRHPSIEENEINDFDIEEDTNEPSMYIEEMSTNVMDKEEDEEENLTTDIMIQSKKKKFKTSTTMPIESTTIANNNNDDDDEWSRIRSLADIESPLSNEFFSFNNRTLISSVQASIFSNEPKSSHKMSKNKLIIMILLISSITIFLFSLFCLKVKQPSFIQRLRLNINVALLFCCEAGKFLFSSSKIPQSIANTPTTIRQHKSLPIPIADYQSSEYYMNNCHTTQSIYDNDPSAGGKSIYSIDDDGLEESVYTTRYDQYHEGDTC
jgi:hypothetical protein